MECTPHHAATETMTNLKFRNMQITADESFIYLILSDSLQNLQAQSNHIIPSWSSHFYNQQAMRIDPNWWHGIVFQSKEIITTRQRNINWREPHRLIISPPSTIVSSDCSIKHKNSEQQDKIKSVNTVNLTQKRTNH